jgi:hypothetical protein
MGVAAMAVEAAGADIMEVIMGAVGVMEVVEVIIMDIFSPHSLVMAMVPMPTQAAAILAIQG